MLGVPPILRVGSAAILIQVQSLARDWAISEANLNWFLDAFGIPRLNNTQEQSPDHTYISLYALESALFKAGMPPETFGGDSDLERIHQELAGVLYSGLTRDYIRERVVKMAKVLTSKEKKPRISGRSKT